MYADKLVDNGFPSINAGDSKAQQNKQYIVSNVTPEQLKKFSRTRKKSYGEGNRFRTHGNKYKYHKLAGRWKQQQHQESWMAHGVDFNRLCSNIQQIFEKYSQSEKQELCDIPEAEVFWFATQVVLPSVFFCAESVASDSDEKMHML